MPRSSSAFASPTAILPRIVDSSGAIGACHALPGAPLLCGIAGDQQASLVGQGCTRPGLAKATFGTGGMFDQCTGSVQRPATAARAARGTFPIVAFQVGGVATWGVEAVMLSAGTCVEWLRDDLGLLSSAAESADRRRPVRDDRRRLVRPGPARAWARRCGTSAPAGTLVGLTRGSGRPELVRAVLEGVAHRGADLVEAAEADSGLPIAALRVDGGMSDNEVFVAALADAIGRPVEISPVLEATTLGAGLLAGLAIGTLRVARRDRRELLAPADRRAPDRRRHPVPRPRTLAGGERQGRGHHPRALRHLVLTAVAEPADSRRAQSGPIGVAPCRIADADASASSQLLPASRRGR